MKMINVPLLSLGDVREVLKEHRKQKVKQGLSDTAARFLDRKKWEYQIKHKLELAIPTGRRYRVLRKMACLFDKESSVENYKLARCFTRKLRGHNNNLRKLKMEDYLIKKTKYDEQIRNRFKILNCYLKGTNYVARFGKHRSKIVSLKLVAGNGKNSLDITPKVG